MQYPSCSLLSPPYPISQRDLFIPRKWPPSVSPFNSLSPLLITYRLAGPQLCIMKIHPAWARSVYNQKQHGGYFTQRAPLKLLATRSDGVWELLITPLYGAKCKVCSTQTYCCLRGMDISSYPYVHLSYSTL